MLKNYRGVVELIISLGQRTLRYWTVEGSPFGVAGSGLCWRTRRA